MQHNELAANQTQGDFVFLRADGLRLLFPLHDIVHTAYAEGADMTNNHYQLADSNQLSEYEMSDNLAISETLELLPEIPADRFILVQMRGIDVRLGWNEMTILTDQLLNLEPIPAQFLEHNTPLRNLVMLDKNPVFFCHTEQFLSYLFPKKVSAY